MGGMIMDLSAQLTKRELQVAELLAWGASKKEVPDLLPIKQGKKPISVRTVEVLTKSIYEKLHIQKVNELSVWYFCTHFHISMDLNPLMRRIVAAILLLTIVLAEVNNSNDFVRTLRVRPLRSTVRTTRNAAGRRSENTLEL